MFILYSCLTTAVVAFPVAWISRCIAMWHCSRCVLVGSLSLVRQKSITTKLPDVFSRTKEMLLGTPLTCIVGNCPALQTELAPPQSDFCHLQVGFAVTHLVCVPFLKSVSGSRSLPRGLVSAATVVLVAGLHCCSLEGGGGASVSKHWAKPCGTSLPERGEPASSLAWAASY